MPPSDHQNQPLSLTGSAAPPVLAEPRGLVDLQRAVAGQGPASSQGPPGLTAVPTFGMLLKAFRRRWPLAVGLGLVGALLGAAVVFLLLPPKYTATARLRLNSRPAPSLFGRVEHAEVDPTIWRANQMAFIKNPFLLNRALSNDKVKGLAAAGNSTEWLEGALKIDFNLGPEIMRITLSGDSQEEVAPLLNAVVDAYLGDIRDKDEKRRNQVLTHLRKIKEDLETKRFNTLVELRQKDKHGLVDPDQVKFKYDVLAPRLSAAEKSYSDYLAERGRKERELGVLNERYQKFDNESTSTARVSNLLSMAPQLLAIEKDIADVDTRIEYIKRVGTNPDLSGPYREKESLKRAWENMARQLRPSIEARVRAETQEDLKSQIDKLTPDVAALKAGEKAQYDSVKAVRDEAERLAPGNRPLEIQKLLNSVTQTDISRRKLEGDIADIEAEPVKEERITPLEVGEMPKDRDYTRQARFALAAALGLFGLTLFGVSFWECRARRVNNGDDLVRGLGMSLVGTLPTMPERSRRPLNGLPTGKDLYWQTVMTESVDTIRTMLLHASRADQLQVIMISSAVGGEGKTSLATQLATSLARAWRKTLLIDGDLRNPAAHKLFDMPLEPGFSEVLRGDTSPDDAIKATQLGRLWLMPAGHWDSHAVQALAQDDVKKFFDHLKTEFDFIIVDSCPVLPVADSLLLGQHVDGVLLSVLRDVSRLPAVYAANQRLHALNIRSLGAVIIGGGSEVASYGYGVQSPAMATK